jgi:hypothetical protein
MQPFILNEQERNTLKQCWFSRLGFQGKIFVYCVIALSFTLLFKSIFFSSIRFSVEVYFLTFGIRDWIDNLEYELKPRSIKSHKSKIFKFVPKRMETSSRIEIK